MKPQTPGSNKISTIVFGGTVAFASVLTGCGMSGGTGSNANPIAQPASLKGMQGSVHGGNQPVQGSKITIYVVGINTPGSGVTGYGSGATSVATTTTDTTGSFSFPAGSYTCPTPTREAYVVATGGNPGLSGATVNNTDLTLMAALGPCPAGGNLLAGSPTNGIPAIPFADINEVTTVAAVWALQQFMAPPTSANAGAPNIGAPNTAYSNGLSSPNTLSVQSAVIGMNNAFTTASMMVDISTGTAPNTNFTYATPETAKINTLANITAACVNTDPTQSSTCSNLFTDATPSGSTNAAADTVQALWYIAQNPINNISNLYNYGSASPPFVPYSTPPGTLSGSTPSAAAFNDATIAINYAPSSSGLPVLGKTYGLAIDAYGNAWFGNDGQAAVANASPTGAVAASIAELGPNGAALVAPITSFPLSTTGGTAAKYTVAPPTNTRTFDIPSQLAIDLTNRPWVVNGSDVAYTGGTTACSSADFCAGDLAVSSASTGTSVAGGVTTTGYTVADGPTGLTIDGSNNVFAANSANTFGIARAVSRMSALDGSGFAYSGATAPNNLPGASVIMGVDTNPNVPGGIVWALTADSCIQKVDGSNTAFGLLGLYGGTSVNGLTKSEVGTNYDPDITLGAGTAATTNPAAEGNCDATNISIGQILQSGMSSPVSIAFDSSNGAWITDVIFGGEGFDGLTYITAPNAASGAIPSSATLINGVASSPTIATPTAGTTLNVPEWPEVDGNNHVWVSQNTSGSVVEASVNTTGATPVITLMTPGQGSAIPGAAYGIGFVHSVLVAKMLAIDPSGNVWVSNGNTNSYTNQSGGTTALDNSVTVIVGAAGPVVTPISLRLHNTRLGQKP
jgi:hypothetical protein